MRLAIDKQVAIDLLASYALHLIGYPQPPRQMFPLLAQLHTIIINSSSSSFICPQKAAFTTLNTT